ncbi:MAG TPA: hypothetical protein VIS56_02100 [Candidatus Saccharimonadales bacterium]
MQTKITDPTELMEELARDIKDCEPYERVAICRGYASHMRAMQAAEVDAALHTFQNEPENFVEIAEARKQEILTGKAPFDAEVGDGQG